MKKHTLWMLIGCVLPLLLIFVFAALGVKSGWLLLIFIVLMFACHLFMIGGHGGDGHKHGNNQEDKHERS